MSAEPDYRRALTIGTFVLIRVSEAYAKTSASPPSDLLTFGDTLRGIDCHMWEIHMVFYGVGALAPAARDGSQTSDGRRVRLALKPLH